MFQFDTFQKVHFLQVPNKDDNAQQVLQLQLLFYITTIVNNASAFTKPVDRFVNVCCHCNILKTLNSNKTQNRAEKTECQKTFMVSLDRCQNFFQCIL